MREVVNELTVETLVGDISQQVVDAIVCPANTDLWIGSQVGRRLADVVGDSFHAIEREAMKQAPAPLGSVVRTSASHLRARFVYHAVTVDAMARSRSTKNAVTLATRSALLLSGADNCRTIAFPLLGTGTGLLDLPSASEAMMGEFVRHGRARMNPREVRVVCRTELAKAAFEVAFKDVLERTTCTCSTHRITQKHAFWCPAMRWAAA